MLSPACLGDVIGADVVDIDCQQGSRVLYDSVAFCIFCFDDSNCPADAPHRLKLENGVVCSTRAIMEFQVPIIVEDRLAKRCANWRDASADESVEAALPGEIDANTP